MLCTIAVAKLVHFVCKTGGARCFCCQDQTLLACCRGVTVRDEEASTVRLPLTTSSCVAHLELFGTAPSKLQKRA